MNNQIILQGRRELIDASSSVVTGALAIRALSNTAFTALVYKFQSAPANADTVAAATLPAGQQLEYVNSVNLTSGLVEVIYQF